MCSQHPGIRTRTSSGALFCLPQAPSSARAESRSQSLLYAQYVEHGKYSLTIYQSTAPYPARFLQVRYKGVLQGFRQKAYCCPLIKVSKKTSWWRLETPFPTQLFILRELKTKSVTYVVQRRDHFVCLCVPQPRAWHALELNACLWRGRDGWKSNWGGKTDSKDSTRALIGQSGRVRGQLG